MKIARTLLAFVVPMSFLLSQGCTVSKVDFSTIKRPPRAAELDAYNVFVGSWSWEAEMLNADGPHKKWTGTANWSWALDNRILRGTMSAKSGDTRFDSDGVWSWHPKSKKYIWWMFNNWGYPQEGTARYDAAAKSWRMDYRSVGLDGTTSHGQYTMTVIDENTLDWHVEEWATVLHLVKKMEMKGTYTRQ